MPAPNSFTVFQDLVKTGAMEPALGNLYSVEFGFPAIIKFLPGFQLNPRKYYEAINYFADEVTIPSRNVTTGDIKNFGVTRTYATGQTANELSISFLVTKDQFHRELFEKWMNKMAPDSENRVGFYDDYTTNVYIKKWERGSNLISSVRKEGVDFHSRLNKAVGVYQFVKVYPYNMGTQEYGNAQGGVMKLDVQFKYERYRFTTKVKNQGDWTQDVVVNDFNKVSQLLDLSVGRTRYDHTDFGV
tara:strand:+ start:6647 stop:7378 length:732 start_codon:yes stop_codon:yes gene_type:complete